MLALLFLLGATSVMSVRVEIVNAAPGNAKVTKSHQYAAQVTLSIENADGSLTPSGWSTRKEGGGDGKPFSFTPGQNLIAGWTEGVLQMREGERAKIHVPVRGPAWRRGAARRGAASALRALLSRAKEKTLRNPRPPPPPRSSPTCPLAVVPGLRCRGAVSCAASLSALMR